MSAAARLILLLASVALAACIEDTAAGDDASSPVGDGGLGDASTADAAVHDNGELTPGIATLAGFSEPGHVDGRREVALFDDPVNLVIAGDGAIYVCDFNNDAIREVAADGSVTTLTTDPRFSRPFGIALSPAGELYVQTDRNSRGQSSGALWRIDRDDGTAELVADDIGRARGLAVLADGRLVLVDHLSHYLRLFNPSTGASQILAGRELVEGFVEGTGGEARFATPYDVVVGPNGDLFVADLANHRIRRVTLAGVVTTLAGDGVAESRDGALATARFAAPKALAVGGDGRLYVTDTLTATLRAIDLDAGTVTTVAGTGVPGFADAEDPRAAQFFGLEGLAADPSSHLLYLADGDVGGGEPYHRIRRLDQQ